MSPTSVNPGGSPQAVRSHGQIALPLRLNRYTGYTQIYDANHNYRATCITQDEKEIVQALEQKAMAAHPNGSQLQSSNLTQDK